MKRNILFVFIIMTFLFTGCSPSASPNTNNQPSVSQNYQVEIISLTEPVYQTIRTEEVDQPNCKGTGEVDNVIERTMGINHSIEVGLGLTVDVDGKLELFGTGVDLGAAISSELGYQYGLTESISRSIVVRAAPKTHMIHKIELSEVWEAGTARVTSNNQSLDIPFRFRANFSIDLIESVPVNCDTGQILQPQITAQISTPTTIVVAQECTSTISSSRPVIQNGTGSACWLQLVDGAPTEIVFNFEGQITYRTSTSGDDIYFYIAVPGDRISDVVGATIRPYPFVLFGYGGYEQVKNFEINYHNPGGAWVACLRDANDGFRSLNSVCN